MTSLMKYRHEKSRVWGYKARQFQSVMNQMVLKGISDIDETANTKVQVTFNQKSFKNTSQLQNQGGPSLLQLTVIQPIKIKSNICYSLLNDLVCCLQSSMHFEPNVFITPVFIESSKDKNNRQVSQTFANIIYTFSFQYQQVSSEMNRIQDDFKKDCDYAHQLLIHFRDRYALQNKRLYLIKKFKKMLQDREKSKQMVQEIKVQIQKQQTPIQESQRRVW